MHSDTKSGETVGLDSLFGALANEQRLRILVSLYLADPDEEIEAADLVAADEDPDAITPGFHHTHFPKLADLGLVEWDREAHTVRRGPDFRAVDRLLDCLVVRGDGIGAGLLAHEV